MKLLLEKGVQPNFEDEGNNTPLSRAVEKGNVAVVQLLLAKEAKMDFRYKIVSECLLYLKVSTRLMVDTVIVGCK